MSFFITAPSRRSCSIELSGHRRRLIAIAGRWSDSTWLALPARLPCKAVSKPLARLQSALRLYSYRSLGALGMIRSFVLYRVTMTIRFVVTGAGGNGPTGKLAVQGWLAATERNPSDAGGR